MRFYEKNINWYISNRRGQKKERKKKRKKQQKKIENNNQILLQVTSVERSACLCVCVCVFIKLHITAQSGLVILVILCYSR